MTLLGTWLENEEYDVVICGAGVAGLTLARQLKLKLPELSILILEKAKFPMPIAAHKVGESLVEASSFYLSETLGLKDYLATEYRKNGLRYFWTAKDSCLSACPEIGFSRYSHFPSYQIDVGKLENHLIESNRQMGIQVVDDVSVTDMALGQDNDLHTITYKAPNSEITHQAKGRWVIDAMGRRRFLQRKLNLGVESKDVPHSAVWFRVKGRLDVSDFVPESKSDWHDRVPERKRFYSTNHFMGDGYWVWIIPLATGYTSVGIVTREKFHPISDYGTPELAMDWLRRNEALLHEHVKNYAFVDFMKLRGYSHSAKQIFSEQRWATVGVSGLFSDPFYSPGFVFIGYENTMATKLIELDCEGKLSADRVQGFNRFACGACDADRFLNQTPYEYFGRHHIWSLRYLWAITISWGLGYPQMFNSIYLCPEKAQAARELTQSYFFLAVKLEDFFVKWAAQSNNSFTFKFIDCLRIPFLKEIYTRNTKSYENFDDVLDNYRYTTARIEEFAQQIFLMAVRDVLPHKLSMFDGPVWLNPWAISLQPDRWEKDGLFRPKSAMRDWQELRISVESLYEDVSDDRRGSATTSVSDECLTAAINVGDPSETIGIPQLFGGSEGAPY